MRLATSLNRPHYYTCSCLWYLGFFHLESTCIHVVSLGFQAELSHLILILKQRHNPKKTAPHAGMQLKVSICILLHLVCGKPERTVLADI